MREWHPIYRCEGKNLKSIGFGAGPLVYVSLTPCVLSIGGEILENYIKNYEISGGLRKRLITKVHLFEKQVCICPRSIYHE